MTLYSCCICGEEITDTMLADAATGHFFHPDCLPAQASPELPPEDETPPLPEWVKHWFNPLFNRIAILEDFEERGVQFRVHDGRLQYLDPDVSLTDAEHGFINGAAEALRQAFWKRCGICTRCGMESAARLPGGERADWCNDCIREEGWKHYQRLSTKRKEKKSKEAEPTAIVTEEKGKSLWD